MNSLQFVHQSLLKTRQPLSLLAHNSQLRVSGAAVVNSEILKDRTTAKMNQVGASQSRLDLYDLLQQNYEKNINIYDNHFLDKRTINEILTYENILAWAETHPLRRDEEPDHSKKVLVDTIFKKATLLFAILIRARLEYLTYSLLTGSDRLSDQSLPLSGRDLQGLNSYERRSFYEHSDDIGLILSRDHDHSLSKKFNLPLMKREYVGNGSFGSVFRCEVAPGHLTGYKNVLHHMI